MKIFGGNIYVVETPGSWALDASGTLDISSKDRMYLAEICKNLLKIGKNRRAPICIDYMPISFYDNESTGTDVRTMYCAVMPMQSQSMDNRFRICFRSKPFAGISKSNEHFITNALSKYIFNYAALSKLLLRSENISTLQDAQDILRTANEITANISKMLHLFMCSELSAYCDHDAFTQFNASTFSEVKDVIRRAYGVVCQDISVGDLSKIITMVKSIIHDTASALEGIKKFEDSVLTLAVYVYIKESDAIKAAPYLVDLHEFSIEDAGREYAEQRTQIEFIDSINAINIRTASIAILEELRKHSIRLLSDRVAQDTQAAAALQPVIGVYLTSSSGNDIELQVAYDRHMFIANYELLQLHQLNRGMYTNNAQNLIGAFSEYVTLVCKFQGVPNPIFDTRDGICPLNVLTQQGSTGVFANALYQYATFTNGQYETFDHMIELSADNDEYSALHAVLVPCSLFDSLAAQASSDGLFIEPKTGLFTFGAASKDNMLTHSAYMSAIIMSAMLSSIAASLHNSQVFTVDDGHRLADSKVVAGYYTFDTLADKSRSIPRNVQGVNVFDTCGNSVPLHCGEYVVPLSYYDMLLYKALVVSKRTPIGIDTIKRGLDFTRWLNLNPKEVIED